MVDDKVLGGGWEKNFEEFWQGMLHCPVDETRTKFIIQVTAKVERTFQVNIKRNKAQIYMSLECNF